MSISACSKCIAQLRDDDIPNNWRPAQGLAWLGHAHMQTTEIYLRADTTEKIEAIEGVTPPALRRGRFTVPDKLIASLRGA